MKAIFFGNIEILYSILKMKKQIEKVFCFSEIIAFELAGLNYLYEEENTCH